MTFEEYASDLARRLAEHFENVRKFSDKLKS